MTLSILDMIEEAYDRVQINARSGYDMRSARRSLNILLSEWTNRGLNLWTVVVSTYALPTGVPSVGLASDTYDTLDVALRDASVNPPLDIILERISPTDYLSIPMKQQRGMPTQYSIESSPGQVTLKPWMVPDRDYSLIVNELKIIPDISGYVGSADIPPRFQAALISGLAYNLSLKRAPQRAAELRAMYEADFMLAADEERDRSSFFMAPDLGSR